jgi:hypothetical protein
MADSLDVERLNLVDLDVEDLEKRLEMADAGATLGYYCGTNNCGNVSAQTVTTSLLA